MNRTLGLALCASAAFHLGAAAALHGSDEVSTAPPKLMASLRTAALDSASLPLHRSIPVLSAAAEEKPVARRRGTTELAPRAASTAPSAPNPVVAGVPNNSDAGVPGPIHAPSASAAVAVTAALEPPQFDAAYLANPPPAYPSSARRRGIEGTVIVEALVGLGGEAHDVKLVASAGNETLDRAAIEAVRGWRFLPARRGNQLVEASVRIPLVFRLN